MFIYFITCFFLYFSYSYQESLQSSQSPLKVHLFHSLGTNNRFIERGIVEIVVNPNLKAYIAKNVSLNRDDLKNLKDLSDKNLNYYIKAVTFDLKGRETKSVMSFINACFLYSSNFEDKLVFVLDFNYQLLGLSINTEKAECKGIVDKNINSFNSSLFVFQTINGPIPDTQTYIQRLEQERGEKLRGESQDNRSFFAKYWMYIIPVVIFIFLSGASNPDVPSNASR